MSGDFKTDLEIIIKCVSPGPHASTVHVTYHSGPVNGTLGTTLRIGRPLLAQYRSGADWAQDVHYAERLVGWAFERCVLTDGHWSLEGMKAVLLAKQKADSGIYPWDGWLIGAGGEALVPWAVDLRGAAWFEDERG